MSHLCSEATFVFSFPLYIALFFSLMFSYIFEQRFFRNYHHQWREKRFIDSSRSANGKTAWSRVVLSHHTIYHTNTAYKIESRQSSLSSLLRIFLKFTTIHKTMLLPYYFYYYYITLQCCMVVEVSIPSIIFQWNLILAIQALNTTGSVVCRRRRSSQ